ncbi:MAG: CatA-like O-acetyltransferase, family 2 [Paludibacteraceae bacterium]|nr:CatA-like O-acetyltransferase, family 2 [Paludibacteraceae bacterium]
MRQEVNPQDTNRAQAFELWMKSPMPMVTLTKTLDVTRLRKIAKKRKAKFNMLFCWCIAKVASELEEFYLLPHQGKLYMYDRMAVNVIVKNVKGGLNSCDVPYYSDWQQFSYDYDILTDRVARNCEDYPQEEFMVVGTSSLIQTELDSIVNQYTELFTNPFMSWGKIRQGFFKSTLPISFQFHHAQMDGGDAAKFLELLQQEISQIS